METTFSERVITAALSIPKGRVASYGDIARVCGGGGQAARSVNGILVRAYNHGQTQIPFHRIVYSNGRVWKSSPIFTNRKKLYDQEGIEIDEKGYIINFPLVRYQF